MAARKSIGRNREKLEQLRAKAASALPDLQATLRGSLLKRFLQCGNAKCRCHRGRRHGPYYYLTVNKPGRKVICQKIPRGREAQVKVWLKNYKRIKKGLEKISDINLELIRLPEESD